MPTIDQIALPLDGGGLGGGEFTDADGRIAFGADLGLRPDASGHTPTLPFPHRGGRVLQ